MYVVDIENFGECHSPIHNNDNIIRPIEYYFNPEPYVGLESTRGLPSNWSRRVSRYNGLTYYCNVISGESIWNHPNHQIEIEQLRDSINELLDLQRIM